MILLFVHRHSDEMIKKLRGAGLGWRDEDASNNAEKLGMIVIGASGTIILQVKYL